MQIVPSGAAEALSSELNSYWLLCGGIVMKLFRGKGIIWLLAATDSWRCSNLAQVQMQKQQQLHFHRTIFTDSFQKMHDGEC